MDLKMIKENLTFPIKAPHYRVGVDGFMSYANSSLTRDGRLRCPCVKCVNNKLLNLDDVNYHLLQYGIMRNYSTWVFHGENVDQVSTSPSTEPMVEKETMTHMDMRQLVHDAFGHSDDDSSIGRSMDEGIPGPNKEAQRFYSLLKDAKQELWPGCELTILSMLVLLFHIKSTNKRNNKSFNDLLQILVRAILNGEICQCHLQRLKKSLRN
ncbi:Ectonucleotide pyrophosphatase/phosphodiesterase family member 6 [Bienertia sinuspersici]